jgi:hypothetical protein
MLLELLWYCIQRWQWFGCTHHCAVGTAVLHSDRTIDQNNPLCLDRGNA